MRKVRRPLKKDTGNAQRALEFGTLACGLLAPLLVAGGLIGCDPKHDRTDETQREVAQANAAVQRIHELEKDLRQEGVSLNSTADAVFTVSQKPRVKLDVVKPKFEEIATTGQNLLRIAARADVTFSLATVNSLEVKIRAARKVLVYIQKRQGYSIAEEVNDQTFWSEFVDCRNVDRDLRFYGVRVGDFDRQEHGHLIQRMSTWGRRELALQIRRLLRCEPVLTRGYTILYEPDDTVSAEDKEAVDKKQAAMAAANEKSKKQMTELLELLEH